MVWVIQLGVPFIGAVVGLGIALWLERHDNGT